MFYSQQTEAADRTEFCRGAILQSEEDVQHCKRIFLSSGYEEL